MGNYATATAINSANQAVHPIIHATRPASLPTVPATIAQAARQGLPPPEVDEYEQFSLNKKQKRSSQPAPHHIGSRTPNTRTLMRHAKGKYGAYIHTENAYPNA
jgi:hypothetical protein